VSLAGRGVVGARMEVMEALIRSASEGPPKRAARRSGSRGREGVEVRVVEGGGWVVE